MHKESEEDKQRAVAQAIATRIHNVELACQQADKQSHEEFEAEVKRIKQAHAAEISAVKRKQWVSDDHHILLIIVWKSGHSSVMLKTTALDLRQH